MCNEEIRNKIEKSRLKYWEVAKAIGITPETFSRWLRVDLSKERKERTLKAIQEVKKNL